MTFMVETAWALDPRLRADTVPVVNLALCAVLLNDDANYPWLILVPRRPGAVEIIDLDEGDRALLMAEIAQTADALKAVTACHKLNVAALGNQVAQLHVHVIARERTDAAWPNPVWGKAARKAYETAERERMVAALRGALAKK
jgi:diadenosine tetraphosphate (Ap4A) HIT family hydrolase